VFERFTEPARAVVVLAQEEARLLNHNYIGTEHVLLGLLREDAGVAATALRNRSVSLDTVRTQVLDIVGKGKKPPSGHIPFTPRAKKVLELSLREALKVDCDYIGTEHLLLGVVREGEGVAAQILIKFGGGLDAVRAEVEGLIGAGAVDQERTGSPRPGAGGAGSVRSGAADGGSGDGGSGNGGYDRSGNGGQPVGDGEAALQAEILRLRLLLQTHGIDPDAA
jgi:ATP-dependent Clp protease ATP-binding subunit ClpC